MEIFPFKFEILDPLICKFIFLVIIGLFFGNFWHLVYRKLSGNDTYKWSQEQQNKYDKKPEKVTILSLF